MLPALLNQSSEGNRNLLWVPDDIVEFSSDFSSICWPQGLSLSRQKIKRKMDTLRPIGIPEPVGLRFSFADSSALRLVGLPISITCEITTAKLWDNLNRVV